MKRQLLTAATGFAMRFNGQSGDVDVAFAPYNEQGDDFSADKCPRSRCL